MSIADRVAVYNEALKQVAKIHPIYYDNAGNTGNLILSYKTQKLSTINLVDEILYDDLYNLSDEERLLIYKVTQRRIGMLRILQKSSYYSISNVRSLIVKYSKNLVLSLEYLITALKYQVKESTLRLTLSKTIATIKMAIDNTTLKLPISKRIINIITLGLEYLKTLRMPISKQIVLLKKIELVKTLVLSLSHKIISYAGDKLYEKRLTLLLTKSIISIAAYQNYKERTLVLPISKKIETL